MTDTYQALYLGNMRDLLSQEIYTVSHAIQAAAAQHARPCAIHKPTIYREGQRWCARLGPTFHTGVAGFGKTPEEAMAAFDKAFISENGEAS